MTHKVDCHEFRQRIDKVLDERKNLLHDPVLKNHCLDCEDCNSLLSDYLELESVFDRVADINWGGGVLAETATRHELHPSPFLGRVSLVISALAAVLLVSISLSISNLRNQPDLPVAVATPPGEFNIGIRSTIPNISLANQQPQESIGTGRAARKSYVEDSIHALGKTISEGQLTLARYSMQPATISRSFNQLTQQLEPLNAYYKYSVELPGVRPVHASFNATLDLIQRSLKRKSNNQLKENSDLGVFLVPRQSSV